MANKLALVLPGRGYTSLGPAIRFPVLALEQAGFEAVDISYPRIDVSGGRVPWDAVTAAVAGRCRHRRRGARRRWFRAGRRGPRRTALLIEGADHSLEIAGDARATISAMGELVDAVKDLVQE